MEQVKRLIKFNLRKSEKMGDDKLQNGDFRQKDCHWENAQKILGKLCKIDKKALHLNFRSNVGETAWSNAETRINKGFLRIVTPVTPKYGHIYKNRKFVILSGFS